MPDDFKRELKKGFMTAGVRFRPALTEANSGERASMVAALAQQMVARDGWSPARVENYVRVSLQMAVNAPTPDLILNTCPHKFVYVKMHEG